MGIYEEINTVNVPRTYHPQPKKFMGTIEMGYIYPVLKKLLLPGDLAKISWDTVIRMIQMRVPSYSGIKVKFKAFRLPLRILEKNFYRFMTGYKEYSTQTKWEEPLKKWKPSSLEKTQAGTLWDYLQYQINCIPDDESLPLDYFRQLYGYIYDLYFRNEAIQDSILIDGEPNSWEGEDLLRINWQRDYFTTALPFQQLGDPVGIPIVGSTKAQWETLNGEIGQTIENTIKGGGIPAVTISSQNGEIKASNGALYTGNLVSYPTNVNATENLKQLLNNNIVSLNNLSSVTVSMLRQAFALQMFAEMQARGGIRDIEFLKQNFGVAPNDETLGRPELLGGVTINILNSEVTQTSQNTEESYLGELGGTGLGAGQSGLIAHHAKEYELLMIVMYARPDTMYAQGFKREDTIAINTEFGLPVLGHISEQPIYQRELCATSKKCVFRDTDGTEKAIDRTGITDEKIKEENEKIIGYRPVYDWFREDKNQIAGGFHMYQVTTDQTNTEADETQAYTYQNYDWTEARFFDTRPNKLPKINNEFMQCKPDLRNNIVKENTKQFTKCNTHNILIAINFDQKYWRPISQFGTPGRLDHII
nr:MAG: major capsid protein [Microvirus Sku114]